jgi:predicted kinase
MTQELVLCRGIPASGKSTWSQVWVQVNDRRVRVSRDDIRFSLFGRYENVDEVLVTQVEDAQIQRALKKGYSVVVDDCNIEEKFVRRLAAIGYSAGAKVSIKQFDVDLKTAKARNIARDRVVPSKVLDSMYSRLTQNPFIDLDKRERVEKYVPDTNLWSAIIVDIDGTIAERITDRPQTRSPYDWMRVGEDGPVKNVIQAVKVYGAAGYIIVLMSGRDSVCREVTEKWLAEHDVPYDELYMRAENDNRKDSIVKRELFDKHVRGNYNVEVVLDDRQQVVDMWRELGLTVFQVAPSFD